MAADDTLWEIVDEVMNGLLPAALGVVGDTFTSYEQMPLGLVESDFTDFALSPFQKRYECIEKAQGASLDEIYRVTQQSIDANDS